MVDIEHPILLNEFSKLGIKPSTISCFPDEVKKALRNELPTPVILITLNKDKEQRVMPVRLQTSISNSGEPVLLVYGMNKELQNLQALSPEDFSKIKDGDVLVSKIDDKRVYYQYDPDTNNILSLKEGSLRMDEKLQSVEKILDIELGTEQKKRILEGNPVTVNVGGEESTLGIDLKSPNAFKMLKGNLDEWQRQKEIDYDIAHPEFIGLVQTDQNRWEFLMIQKEGLNSPTLKESQPQLKQGGMKL